MNEVPVHNKHDYAIHVGGKTIPPGETRMVDESMLPDAAERINSEAVAIEEQSDPLLDILDGTIASITEALPGLSADELDRIEQAENDGNTRKGVEKAIAEERLSRATDDGSSDESEDDSEDESETGDDSSDDPES